jgi:hypothetical protein
VAPKAPVPQAREAISCRTPEDCFGKKRLAMTACTQILAINKYSCPLEFQQARKLLMQQEMKESEF